MKPLVNDNGITIKELKDLINSLPETDPYTGDNYTVWIEDTRNAGLSSLAKSIWELNSGDILLSIEY